MMTRTTKITAMIMMMMMLMMMIIVIMRMKLIVISFPGITYSSTVRRKTKPFKQITTMFEKYSKSRSALDCDGVQRRGAGIAHSSSLIS